MRPDDLGDRTLKRRLESTDMRAQRAAAGVTVLCLVVLAAPLWAQTIIEETFTGYPDNALISVDPAGAALGLTGNWVLVPDDDFYVNMTEDDDAAGTGKAAYDRPFDDNGTRIATRSASDEYVLYRSDGDLFYASFRIEPASADGDMTLELELLGLEGGSMDLSFGISGGTYIVGHGGLSAVAAGGVVSAAEQLVVLRIEYGDTASGGADDLEVVTLWVDPVDESSPPVIDGWQSELLETGGGRIATVSIRGDQMDGRPAFFDDLRVGLSFADAPSGAESVIFTDGFETGTTDMWSAVAP